MEVGHPDNLILIIWFFFAWLTDKELYKILIMMVKPDRNMVLKKCGTNIIPENLTKYLNKSCKTKAYSWFSNFIWVWYMGGKASPETDWLINRFIYWSIICFFYFSVRFGSSLTPNFNCYTMQYKILVIFDLSSNLGSPSRESLILLTSNKLFSLNGC